MSLLHGVKYPFTAHIGVSLFFWYSLYAIHVIKVNKHYISILAYKHVYGGNGYSVLHAV